MLRGSDENVPYLSNWKPHQGRCVPNSNTELQQTAGFIRRYIVSLKNLRLGNQTEKKRPIKRWFDGELKRITMNRYVREVMFKDIE